jgi:hypothetical protein
MCAYLYPPFLNHLQQAFVNRLMTCRTLLNLLLPFDFCHPKPRSKAYLFKTSGFSQNWVSPVHSIWVSRLQYPLRPVLRFSATRKYEHSFKIFPFSFNIVFSPRTAFAEAGFQKNSPCSKHRPRAAKFLLLRQPGYPSCWDPCLHAVVRLLRRVVYVTGIHALPHALQRFGTQAWLSAPRLLVVWLYRKCWF